MEQLIKTLHEGGYSCVLRNQGETRTCNRRGVADLYDLFRKDPAFMRGAQIADKVIGKGAAALLVLGNVGEVYADVISQEALRLLRDAGIPARCGKCVPCIINRAGDGMCPLETLCRDLHTAQEMLPVITRFVQARPASR